MEKKRTIGRNGQRRVWEAGNKLERLIKGLRGSTNVLIMSNSETRNFLHTNKEPQAKWSTSSPSHSRP